VDSTTPPDPKDETALFWHIPKSGGTTAKRLYQCMGRTLAHRVGADPRHGQDQKNEIVVFEPHQDKDWKVVNVDTTIRKGIIRAKKLGLVQSHTTDIIFTMEPNFAGQNLYDEDNKGRLLALFRHPVDRAVSMFYYLQTATWEKTYSPDWADMSVTEWASQDHFETDYMVHKLVGKPHSEEVDETDLIIAKELVRQRFIVGLMSKMNESIRRFNIVLGIDALSERGHQCMVDFALVEQPADITPAVRQDESSPENDMLLTKATDKKNSNNHPKFVEGSSEFEAVAARNKLDMVLYKFIESLFDAQKEIIDSYLSAETDIDEEEIASSPQSSDDLQMQRQRAESTNLALLPPGSAVENIEIPDKIQSHIANVDDPIQKSETPFFWHIPKSGGTTLQRLYWCMGETVANEVGANPKFGDPVKHRGLVSFNPWKDNPGKVINVDVSTQEGIVEAKNRGFLGNNVRTEDHPRIDFVSTAEFQFASMMLFTPDHKARMFALFRNPIERAVSKFFYLQKATWEPTYNEKWAKMTVEEWASHNRGEDNWMLRNLVGKGPRDQLEDSDLEVAEEILRTKFVIGLMHQMEQSLHRFNYILGIDESDTTNQKCMEDFSSTGSGTDDAKNKETIVKKNNWNSYAHPQVERGSKAWQSLAKIHSYDVKLFRYIMNLFHDQSRLFRVGQSLDDGQFDTSPL